MKPFKSPKRGNLLDQLLFEETMPAMNRQ